MLNQVKELISKMPMTERDAEEIRTALNRKMEDPITLELTRYEASVLAAITNLIGGNPRKGHPRGACDEIGRKLQAKGFDIYCESEKFYTSGSIFFHTEGE
jgi:hypothetical protein